MNISKVQVQITGEDILGALKEFVQVEGLELNEVIIDRDISIKGAFTKGVKVNFEGALDINGVKDGKIYGRFSRLKVMKLGFFRPFRSLALKFGLKSLEDTGIFANKDEIIIDVNKILTKVPMIKVSMSSVYISGQAIVVEVENVNINLKGKVEEVQEEIEEKSKEEEFVGPINKVKDGYTIGREVVKNKIPDKVAKISDYLLVIPDIVALIYRLLKDSRVNTKTKLSIAAAISYIAVPSDLIPDKIPFVGKIDDLAIIFFALNRIATEVPIEVILENWSGKNELVYVLKNGLDYLINFTGASNVEKLCNIIEELSTL